MMQEDGTGPRRPPGDDAGGSLFGGTLRASPPLAVVTLATIAVCIFTRLNPLWRLAAAAALGAIGAIG